MEKMVRKSILFARKLRVNLFRENTSDTDIVVRYRCEEKTESWKLYPKKEKGRLNSRDLSSELIVNQPLNCC